MSRRNFLTRAGCATVGAWASSLARPGTARAAGHGNPPNVLFISIEDLNDWVGCLDGYEGVVHTPNMDRLAARGVLFTNAHATATVCNPSRTSVMTGIRPSTSGIYLNEHHPYRVAMPDAITLPQHFKNNGYHTVGINKIFHGRDASPLSWDVYERMKEKVHVIESTRHRINRAVTWAQLDGPDEDVGDVYCAQTAARHLKQVHDKPLFLGVGFNRPHEPYFAPKRFFDLYPLDSIVLPTVSPDDLDDVPPMGKALAATYSKGFPELEDPEVQKHVVQAYLACISFTDACVGIVLDALEASPYAENTLAVLWSDHGMHLGEKSHWCKMTLWEESTRVPFIMAGPGVPQAGEACDRVVSLLDMYPTLVDCCGLPPVAALEGQSLRPLLNDRDAPWDHAAITTYGKNNHAVRTARWRYIRYSDGSEELYDHDKDPKEWTNLAKRTEFAKVKTEMAAKLPKVNAEPMPVPPKEPKKRGQ
ncbi:MAG: sulfatase-like hydrolase/transferase [Nitrospiraceae bacterium]|nr:sulfatase-like hydrolase/transferase [Nitrospiraceae bacterium]